REYDPWGNPIQGSSTSGYAFTGREWEPETQLYYYRARYYDPSIGRFLSEDPIRFRGGNNFYRYAAANPANFLDPTGLWVQVHCRPVRYNNDPNLGDMIQMAGEGLMGVKHCYIAFGCDGSGIPPSIINYNVV